VTFLRWAEITRTELTDQLPNATVVLPIGATEQHGPHLPTGTDFLTVEAVAVAASEAAGRSMNVVLTPTIPFGSSDHHLRFGGTLSLKTETATQVLADLLYSISEDGGRRVVIVNGHGGNRGPCSSAAELASVRYGLHTAYVDYWSLIPARPGIFHPGHAGAFETSMIQHLHPEMIRDVPPGDEPRIYPDVPGMVVHSARIWQSIDGYTDQPSRASAEYGASWFQAGVEALAKKICDFDATFGGPDT
jgi:creatinine amidohydrolase